MNQNKIGEIIEKKRKEKNLTQKELANALGVSNTAVSKWENGLSVPDSEMLISISETLETPVSILLGETIDESAADDLKAISEKLKAQHSPPRATP